MIGKKLDGLLKKKSEEEHIAREKIERKLDKKELKIREKIINVTIRHGGIPDGESCGPGKCNCKSEIRESVKAMKEIISYGNFNKLLTPFESERFAPIIEEFRKTGTLRTHPHDKSGQLIRF